MKKIIIHKSIILSIYVFIALLIECLYFHRQYGVIFPTYFLYDFSILLFLGAFSLICGKYRGQIVASYILWFVEIALMIANLSLGDANGDVFTWDMLLLIIDASKAATGAGGSAFFALKEMIWYVCISLIGLSGMIVYYKKVILKEQHEFRWKNYRKSVLFAILVGIICVCTNVVNVAYIQNQKTEYKVGSDAYLYESSFLNQEAIRQFGTFGYYYLNAKKTAARLTSENEKNYALLNEYLKEGNKKDISNPYTGVSKGNNLIYILFETGEFFGLHPQITPTICQLLSSDGILDSKGNTLDGGILLSNYHSKSQTNISEAQSLFGSYPLTGVLNYNYLKNEVPFTLPNMFRNAYPKAQIASYHSNDGSYYNRYNAHMHYGFDQHYAAEEMKIGQASVDTWIRLDSEMMDACLKQDNELLKPLIPQEHEDPFFSYIVSFSTHGPYENRKDMAENIKYVQEKVVEPYSTLNGKTIDLSNEDYGNAIQTYLAAAHDFDLSIARLLDGLKENNELDKTTIFIFSDHYAYYSNLSALSKGYEADMVDASEIYNVPAFIFDTKLKAKLKEQMPVDHRIVTKEY